MDVIKIIENVANTIIENKDYLTELDRVIGDGDHGINLSRGFEKILENIDDLKNQTPSEIMTKISMILISNVGGASGAIYGTAFMRAGQYLKTVNSQLNSTLIYQTWKEMIDGIQKRGNAKLGDKTMLDVQILACEEFKKEANNNKSIKECFESASKVAKIAMEKTKDNVATKGRASYLGERSIGHIDPGAASSYLIIKTIADSL